MKLNNNRQITIAVENSRRGTNWRNEKLNISDLYEKLKTPVIGVESMSEYLSLKKAQQDDLKDVGGFVGGSLNGTHRTATAVAGRDLVTLDFDTIPAYGTDGILQKLDSFGFGYCAYSTRKHVTTKPRLRIIIPLDRTVTPDEYEPIARMAASSIGIQMADPTTFQASRLMFWPSMCKGAEYIFRYADKELLSADQVLGMYDDWRDFTQWPQVPGATPVQKMAAKQGDPDTKPGIVGAFNRAYETITNVMDAFLPELYTPVDNDPNRFTYLNGSTTGGAILYNDGKFLYSHHATDPCSGKLVNCFDFLRLHKYGDLDDEAQPNTPIAKMPSFLAMSEFAAADKKTATLIVKERMQSVEDDFNGVAVATAQNPAEGTPPTDVSEWVRKLEVSKTGAIKPTIDNVRIILENDENLKERVVFNTFRQCPQVLRPMPWGTQDKAVRRWRDSDDAGLRWYLEKCYGIKPKATILDGFEAYISNDARSVNDVQDYINTLDWDKTPRLDTLFIDYLGAIDDEKGYVRAVTRKAFAAAVSRAMNPGCKFDNMPILCGPQGIGKSTILDKLSKGWFNDSIRTFEGKEPAELIQGVWLVEIGELNAFRKSDVSRIKQFLSLRVDRYRAAYGRNVQELPRSCVFFGTCNEYDFLTDTTGNRRFWPIDVGAQKTKKSVFRDLTPHEVDMIWAEAKMRWQIGEPLYLEGDMLDAARTQQEDHSEMLPNTGEILDFIGPEKLVPDDWAKWDIDKRSTYWQGRAHNEMNLVKRDRICAKEVMCELLGYSLKDAQSNKAIAREINAVIARSGNWKRVGKTFRHGIYGVVRGFERIMEE